MNSYRIAVHEAGHTVVGRALGMTCGDTSIIRDPEEGEEGHSICADPYTVQWDWEQRGKFLYSRARSELGLDGGCIQEWVERLKPAFTG